MTVVVKSRKSKRDKLIQLTADGKDGQDAESGADGLDGSFHQLNKDTGAPASEGPIETTAVTNNTNHHGTDGSPASFPTKGHDGQDLTISLETVQPETENEVSFGGSKNNPLTKYPWVRIHVITPRTVFFEEYYSLTSVPLIKWFTRGGDGGNGADGGDGGHGCDGIDGTNAELPDIPATDGISGGNGGQGGCGAGGADGGKGGHVKVLVHEKDMYLLMALDPCQHSLELQAGGKGGKKGEHGRGGKGGTGGKGGKGLNTTIEANGKRVKRNFAPGIDGVDGADGVTPMWNLTEGRDGLPGHFSIRVTDGSPDGYQEYASRYDLQFENLEFCGQSPLATPGHVEFGDIVKIGCIKVKNVGTMPLPPRQEIHFKLRDTGDPNLSPLPSRNDSYLPATSSYCQQGNVRMSEGELQFFAGYPGHVENEYDFDPLQLTTYFHLEALQYGPKLHQDQASPFVRKFKNFHTGEGVRVDFRYPIENEKGMRAIRSLHPGEITIVSLPLENVGATKLGGYDPSKPAVWQKENRRLAVRYFLLRSRQYEISANNVRFLTHRRDKRPDDVINLQTGNPKLYDVDVIESCDYGDFKTKISLEGDVPYYKKLALIVDVFIQTLPIPRGVELVQEENTADGLPTMSVIQRRKLEFTCEPKYEEKRGARVVMITSTSTTSKQFEHWTRHVLEDTLGLEYEVFSVSRYGTLDPFFAVQDNKLLRDVFRNKLVIVLTETFKENEHDKQSVLPVHLLRLGCMEQASGFEPSTKFLIVGTNDVMSRDLLFTHLLREATVDAEFPDVAAYQKYITKEMDERSDRGRVGEDVPIRADTINISVVGDDTVKKLKREAESLAAWLREKDPLNQYIIEYHDANHACPDHLIDNSAKKRRVALLKKRTRSCLIVRRGFCRSMNSAVCVIGECTCDVNVITSPGMIMSIVEAMSREMRVELLCDAIRLDFEDKTITAIKFAIVADMIRDCSTFLDARMHMNDDLELSFPSIGVCLESIELLGLIRDCKTDKELRDRTILELSELLARLELVANSKDLRPRFGIVGRSSKKTTKEAMTEIVERLRVQWKAVLSTDIIETHKREIKSEIKEFLQEDSGTSNVNYRAGRKWLQGLNYLHSTANEDVFGIAHVSKRLIELDIDTEMDFYKIHPPSVRVFSSSEIIDIREELDFIRERSKQVANDVQLRRELYILKR